MTPALTEATTQGPGSHFSPSLSLRSLNSETNLCVENSKAMEQSNLSKANGSNVVYADTEQCLQKDLMSLKHFASQSSARYQTVLLLTSSAALNLQNKSSTAWKMEERDTCRQRLHTNKGPHPLLAGVSFQPERKVKRELFPGTMSQLLADVHRLWDITVTEADGIDGMHIPKCMLNGRKEESLGDALAGDCPSPVLSGLADVSKNTSAKEGEATSLLMRCLNQQQVLLNRAKRNQKRLHALLANHAAEHCSQQIRCFVNHRLQKVKVHGKPARLLDSRPNKAAGTNVEGGSCSEFENGVCHTTSAAVRKFTVSATGLLGHIERELDSDATESSSEEDWDEKPRRTGAEDNAEWNWLSGRARVGSCWTWLQAQISELEYKIQQLTDLHSQIRSTKGTVRFREPSKSTYKQETRLTHPGTLLNPAGKLPRPPEGTNPSPPKDFEMSPSSPTLLLKNIEKQSAQLTEMVSSLIVPTSLSPTRSAKSCGHKRVSSGFTSSTARLHEEGSLSLNGFCEQQQVKRRKKNRVRAASVPRSNTSSSARTRPLQAFHKRKLYRPSPDCPTVHLALSPPETVCQYDELLHRTNSCSTWISCGKRRRPWLMSRNVCEIDPYFHPVLSLPSDLPLHMHFEALLKNNHDIKGDVDSTALKEEGDVSPSHAPAHWSTGYTSSCRPQTRYEMRRREGRERRHVSETEAETCISMALNSFSAAAAADISMTPTSAQKSCARRFLTRDPSRRRLRSESSYDIDNIVIPMSLVAPTKVEKLQYKEIITPSWKVVVLEPLDSIPEELEALSDEAYYSRHEKFEQREKARWSLWEKSTWPKRSRSASQCIDVWSENMLACAEECSTPSFLSYGPLDTVSPDNCSSTPQSAEEPQQEKVLFTVSCLTARAVGMQSLPTDRSSCSSVAGQNKNNQTRASSFQNLTDPNTARRVGA
ncbi:hypothetical protein FKM82_016069 [Ascaphus truei]